MSDINPGSCQMTKEMIPDKTHPIWAEILKILPVKTLGNCMCVCKPWKALIKSSSFVAAHIENYTQAKGNAFLLYKHFTNAPEKDEQYTVFSDSVRQDSVLESRHTFTNPFKPDGDYFRVVGSTHGLICLSDDLFSYTYLVILWNPLIHKYIRLPLPITIYPFAGAHISALGFGYDSKKGTHKVVRVCYMRGSNGFDTTPPRVELYSVQEGKWRRGSASSVKDICICDYWWSQCFLHRAVHWVAWERDAETLAFCKNCLLLFDVEEEKFKKMKLPDALAKELTLNLFVSGYDAKLSVLHSVLKGGPTGNQMEHCDIWVKGEYNVGSSWCKMVSIEINTSAGLSWVQCLRRNGDILGFTKKGELASYDPLVKQIKRLGLRGCWLSWSTCSYTESLILLDKKSGVGTYDQDKGPKKKFEIATLSNGLLDMKEKEADSCSEDQERQSSLAHTIYHQGKAILVEQLMKFDGPSRTKEPSELLSLAGLNMSEFIAMAESFVADHR